jgi:hypothetical protein
MFELSEPALSLLKLRLSGQRVEVTDETRAPYQELVAAGLAEPVRTFTRGRDSNYKLTLAAMERREDFLGASIPSPSREESAALPR